MTPLEATWCWVHQHVVGENMCPFARAELRQSGLDIRVSDASEIMLASDHIAEVCRELATSSEPNTLLLVFPRGFDDFFLYLDLVERAGVDLEAAGFSGLLQLASFHPEYRFADAADDAAENYTNRSPYPMVHILREHDVTRAVERHPDAGNIPQRNIARCRDLGREELAARLAKLRR